MLFNSLAFMLFLPIVLLVCAILPQPAKNRFLLVASYYFYGSWDWRFLGLIILTTGIDYWVGQRIYDTKDPRTRKQIVVVSIGVNLLILGFFKYYNFFVDSAVTLLSSLGLEVSVPMLSIILPVGISFYTFQSMSYAIDIYRREMVPAKSFLDFALYVAYFPQLVAGPIERATELLPQILSPAKVTPARVNAGLTLMAVGFIKKILIADSLAPEVDRIFAHAGDMNAGLLLKGGYFFVLQIYCDFSGYSDIARGVSELFGIRLMVNFRHPYLATSLTDFWRRWHISLSTWLRDYLYLPLGGNRGGTVATYRNMMLTMLIGGLWHGANWTYVVWGGLNGVVLVIERMVGIGRTQPYVPANPLWRWVRHVALMIWTFHIWVFVMIFFRVSSLGAGFEYIAGILQFDHITAMGLTPFLAGAAVLAIDIPQEVGGDDEVFLRLPWWVQSVAYACVCFGVLLYGGKELPFIYFQF